MKGKGAIADLFEYFTAILLYMENFSWIPNETSASSPEFVVTAVVSYICLTCFLHRLFRHRPISPRILRPIAAVHSGFLLLLSIIMALGCLVSTLSHAPNLDWIICIPPHTPPSGPVFFWAYIFYLSKILEFVDTLLIILWPNRRLTFLHVFHHSAAVVMCYIWLQTSQSLFPVVLVTNASVHMLMYAYYLSCALGVRATWRRLVTNCQILQFYGSFFVLSLMLYYHFSGSGCSGAWGWIFNAVFFASLLSLFRDFHRRNYGFNAGQQAHQD